MLRRSRRSSQELARAAQWAAALGQVVRLRLLRRLESGPATYQELCAVAGHTSGPLYHHTRSLTLPGLMHRQGRDDYRITSRGRSVLLSWLNVVAKS